MTITITAITPDEARRGPQTWRIHGFEGEVGQTRIDEVDGSVVVHTGVGAGDAGSRRRAAAAGGRAAARALDDGSLSATELEVDAASFGDVMGVAAAVASGAYRFRMTSATEGAGLAPMVRGGSDLDEPIATAQRVARDLVNLPPSAKPPVELAQRVRSLLEPLGVDVRIRERAELEAGGFGGLLAVGKGSANPPALLELSIGDGAPEIAFVGKGVTYDSGGLSIKPADQLITMKLDMAGAAAICAVFTLLPRIAPGRSFAAVIPLVENMPGDAAVRPGDVVCTRGGMLLEVLNTDFEGRVILADALARAGELQPGAIVDVATLTYAAHNALGDEIGALVCEDDGLRSALERAGEVSGDRVWRMPLQPQLEHLVDSQIADARNFPFTAEARVSTAALLLRRCVPDDTPWAHLDMAGPAWRATSDAYGVAGATGYGVRLLAALVG